MWANSISFSTQFLQNVNICKVGTILYVPNCWNYCLQKYFWLFINVKRHMSKTLVNFSNFLVYTTLSKHKWWSWIELYSEFMYYKLSTSIYDLVLIYVCHFHHHFLLLTDISTLMWKILEIIYPRIFHIRVPMSVFFQFWMLTMNITLYVIQALLDYMARNKKSCQLFVENDKM